MSADGRPEDKAARREMLKLFAVLVIGTSLACLILVPLFGWVATVAITATWISAGVVIGCIAWTSGNRRYGRTAWRGVKR